MYKFVSDQFGDFMKQYFYTPLLLFMTLVLCSLQETFADSSKKRLPKVMFEDHVKSILASKYKKRSLS